MGGFGQATPVQGPRRRSVGRPSVMTQYTLQLAQWLDEDPDLAGAEILRRLRLCGYRGGKSALYELVRRLKVRRAATVSAEDSLGPGSIGGQASMILRESQDPNTSADRLNSAQAP